MRSLCIPGQKTPLESHLWLDTVLELQYQRRLSPVHPGLKAPFVVGLAEYAGRSATDAACPSVGDKTGTSLWDRVSRILD